MIEDHPSSLPTANLYIVHHRRERLPPGQQGDQPAWADRILQRSSHTLSQDSEEVCWVTPLPGEKRAEGRVHQHR